MPRDRTELISLKEVFTEWREFRKRDRGLVLVEDRNGLRVERGNRVSSGAKIFLGRTKKPAFQVGFLNACLAKICPCSPEKIKIPILSRLEMERIAEEFKLVGRLERKAANLNIKIDLAIAKSL